MSDAHYREKGERGDNTVYRIENEQRERRDGDGYTTETCDHVLTNS